MTALSLPRLVYTSAKRTLEGSGFGVLARSASWPAELGSTAAELGKLVSPVEEDSFALIRLDRGALIVSRTAKLLDAIGRPGNYLIHLAYDATGRVTPRDADALLAYSVEELRALEATADLPPLVVDLRPPPIVVVDTADREALSAAVRTTMAAIKPGGEVRLPVELPSGVSTAAVLFSSIPRASQGSLSAATTDEPLDEAHARVVLDPSARWEGLRGSDLSDALVDAAAAGELPDDLDPAAVREWALTARWAAAAPETLRAEEVAAVLRSPYGRDWILSGGAARALALGDDAEVDDALYTHLSDEEVAAEVRGIAVAELHRALARGGNAFPVSTRLARLRTADVDRALDIFVADRGSFGPLGGDLLRVVLASAAANERVLLALQPEQLAEAASRPEVQRAAIRAMTQLTDHRRRRTLAATLLNAGVPLAQLETVLERHEVEEILGEEADRARSREEIETLLDATSSAVARGRSAALRAVLFRARLPKEAELDILIDRFAELARDDGWPPDIVAKLELKRRRGFLRR